MIFRHSKRREYKMDWSLPESWQCELCGERDLMWDIPYGICYCDTCHTSYNMLNPNGTNHPHWMMKPGFREAAKLAWDSLGWPVDKISRIEWLMLGVDIEEFNV